MNSDKSDDDTVEFPAAPVPSDPLWSETGSSQVEVDLAAVSDRGLVRENNQDIIWWCASDARWKRC